ncbi:hypothetical protein [Halalkalicoccus salilacus]|uniref:hypothetical protein n=1 Tax=Halalkalicoccus TaxID=332246 RepID=UPI002F9689A0
MEHRSQLILEVGDVRTDHDKRADELAERIASINREIHRRFATIITLFVQVPIRDVVAVQ